MLRIEVTQQGHPPRTYQFDKRRIQVGRGVDCDLVLKAPGISTVHAQIVQSEGRGVVIDQNSTNGTYLHGAPIHGPTPVSPDEAIYICSYCLHITVPSSDKPSASAPAVASTQELEEEPPMIAATHESPQDPAPPAIQPQAPASHQRPPLSVTNHTATIAPRPQQDEARRFAAQKISVRSTGTTPDPQGSARRIEMRRWPVPGAPRHLNQDPCVLAQVFAALAQPYIERNKLPPGDESARAHFYALAQAQLSINLTAQSIHMERGAEDIVRALCEIGPLSELLASGCMDKPHQELVAAPFSPIRIRSTAPLQAWQPQDQGFLHPWALRFAVARLLGTQLNQEGPFHDRRLSNGLRLTTIPQAELETGPLLVLRSPPPLAESWAQYIQRCELESQVQELLVAAVDASVPLIVCETNTGPLSVWNALQSLAVERGGLAHIGWDSSSSLQQKAINYCADLDPHRQRDLCLRAQSLGITPILAVDHPQDPCLRELASIPTALHQRRWLRARSSSAHLALRRFETTLSHLEPGHLSKVGLILETEPSDASSKSSILAIQEFELRAQPSPELRPLFERRDRALCYVADSPLIYEQLAQEGRPLAPPL